METKSVLDITDVSFAEADFIKRVAEEAFGVKVYKCIPAIRDVVILHENLKLVLAAPSPMGRIHMAVVPTVEGDCLVFYRRDQYLAMFN